MRIDDPCDLESMQFIIDHLAAFIVFAAIMLIVAVLNLRGMQSNAETVVNYMVRSGTLEISEMFERDLVNMRTQDQTNEAISRGIFNGGAITTYTCNLTASGDTTKTFTFPTLADPQAFYADPMDAPVTQVMYQLNTIGGSVIRLVEGDTLVHHLYRLDRFVADGENGWSDEGVTFFRVEFAERGDPDFEVPVGGNCPGDTFSKVRFQIQMAQDSFEGITDQESRTQLNFSRYGSTVELSNWENL